MIARIKAAKPKNGGKNSSETPDSAMDVIDKVFLDEATAPPVTTLPPALSGVPQVVQIAAQGITSLPHEGQKTDDLYFSFQ